MTKNAKKKLLPLFKHIFIEVYGVNVYHVCCTREEYDLKIKDEFEMQAPEKSSEIRGTFEIYNKDDVPIYVLWQHKDCSSDLSILVHEVFHTAYGILQNKGLWLTDSSEEAYAYLIQYIFKEILKSKKG